MVSNDYTSSTLSPPYVPRFPPELFLQVFSHADRPTLASLCSSSFAFLELVTPFLYSTVHYDDLAQSFTSRTRRLAELLPQLALNSVQTLHLTLSESPYSGSSPIIYPQISLPKLNHIVIHHSQLDGGNPDWSVLDKLLPSLNPLSIAFCLPPVWYPRTLRGLDLLASTWSAWSVGWSRLDHLVLRGGLLAYYDDDDLDDDGQRIFRSSFLPRPEGGVLDRCSVQLTFDLRMIAMSPDLESLAQSGLLEEGVFDLPLASERPILIKTCSKEMEALIDADLRILGWTYRNRVEISREAEEEGDLVLAEMAWWRRRGRWSVKDDSKEAYEASVSGV